MDYGSGLFSVTFLAGMNCTSIDIPRIKSKGSENITLTIKLSSLPDYATCAADPCQTTVTVVNNNGNDIL